jgi:hypothetical protein
MMNHLQMAHLLMEITVQPGDHVVDMTLGNGHDMKKLLSLCTDQGRFTGFDIAEEAIRRCSEIARLYPDYSIDLRHESHVHCDDLAPFRFAVYNLGYLPGSDKTVTTKADSTIESLTKLRAKIQSDGRISLTAYRTHDKEEEANALACWFSSQSLYRVYSWQRVPDDGHAPIVYMLTPEERK